MSSSGPDGGTVHLGDGGASCTGNENVQGGFPPSFWDASNIPAATGAMVMKILNRTNGKYADSEIYWSFQGTMQSIAQAPIVQFPAGNLSGRMYFYICPAGQTNKCGSQGATDYYDFWEYTIGTNSINYDTSRVDAFGLKIALYLHTTTADFYTVESCPTFAEDRAATFASYVASVPAIFQPCARTPYRIVEPGGCGFNAGGANAEYYRPFIQQIYANNPITTPPICPVGGPYAGCLGPNGSGLGANPSLSGAIMRHVAAAANPGTWSATGQLTAANNNFWTVNNASTFYGAPPADYYAWWIHSRAIKGKQYAFPYDDSGGNSSDIGAKNMVYMVAAIGW
jgi:hypothetical protein